MKCKGIRGKTSVPSQIRIFLPTIEGKILFNPGDAESLHGNLRKGAIRQRGTLAKIDEARVLVLSETFQT